MSARPWKGRSRPRSVSAKELQRLVEAEQPDAAEEKLQLLDGERPRTRGDCMTAEQLVEEWYKNHPDAIAAPPFADGPNSARPCPWAGCKYHLYSTVEETGSLRVTFPELEPDELQETCALDVADRRGLTLEEVGELVNLTRERVRQIEVRSLHKLMAKGAGE